MKTFSTAFILLTLLAIALKFIAFCFFLGLGFLGGLFVIGILNPIILGVIAYHKYYLVTEEEYAGVKAVVMVAGAWIVSFLIFFMFSMYLFNGYHG